MAPAVTPASSTAKSDHSHHHRRTRAGRGGRGGGRAGRGGGGAAAAMGSCMYRLQPLKRGAASHRVADVEQLYGLEERVEHVGS